MRSRHVRRKLAFPWPEWVAWAMVAIIWAVSSATVWGVLSTIRSGTVETTNDGEGFVVTWSWPWDQ